VGLGYSERGRRLDRPLGLLARDAALGAIADAGLTVADIDGVTTYADMPVHGSTASSEDGVAIVSAQYMVESLRIGNAVRWHSQTSRGMFVGSVMQAVQAVVSGACRHALVWRALHMPRGRYTQWVDAHVRGGLQYYVPYGALFPAIAPAMEYREYMHRYGAKREDLGRFLVRNRANAQLNERAYWHGKELSLDDYMDSRMIADPFCVYDCDIPLDVAAAVVITTAERAESLKDRAAFVRGYAPTAVPLDWWSVDLDRRWDAARVCASMLWRTAGLSHRDVQAAMVYDGFSSFVYTWLEVLGFCGRGEAWEYVGNEPALDRVPISPGGGNLGEGRLHGTAQVGEAVLQVTGGAGPRQIEGVEHVVVTNGRPGDTDSSALVISGSASD
jgi:acetyl-CoA acetyltransferase